MKGKYLILTLVPYPYGGGESFMFQTIDWMKSRDYECIWVAFNRKVSESTKIQYKDGCIFHTFSGYPSNEHFEEIYNLYNPDIIHIQGPIVYLAYPFYKNRRIPLLMGFHFWSGIMNPDDEGKWNNTDILSHVDKEILDPICQDDSENIKMYVASDFMNEVITGLGGREIKNVIYPVSSPKQYLVQEKQDCKYITLINTNKLKGGELFYEIIKEIKDLPFLAICNEPNTDGLDEKIAGEINGRFLYYTDIKEVYSKTKILLIPSQVDETFSRVAYEGAANGIPIITSGKGFIKTMLKDSVIIIDEANPKLWIEAIRKLYKDEKELVRIGEACNQASQKFSIKKQESKFNTLVDELHHRSLNKNIMILAPWCDQGLGIQSRLYSKLLRSKGYNVHIFSYLSYFCIDQENKFQNNSKEWLDHDSIYYSYNTREEITKCEIRQFVNSRNIGICLIPEICYPQIFEKIGFLKEHNVRVYGIPNIETVRSSEIEKFSTMNGILCNTHQCYDVLKKVGVENLKYIGHCIPQHDIKIDKSSMDTGIKFLHIAGYNGVTRKQTLIVLKAFSKALKKRPQDNFSLTVTFSKNIPSEALRYKSSRIKIIAKPLSYGEIIGLYWNHHVSIQIASHEGLGLGFYESLSCQTPVITLDQAPHNEVIRENKSGWLIPSETFDLEDNDEALVQGGSASYLHLYDKIITLVSDTSKITKVTSTISEESMKWQSSDFIERLINSISL